MGAFLQTAFRTMGAGQPEWFAGFLPASWGTRFADALQWLYKLTGIEVLDKTDNNFRADLVESNCLTFSGGTGKLITPTMSHGETVDTLIGTAVATVGVGEITFTNGTLYSLLLSNGDCFTASSGEGSVVYNTATPNLWNDTTTWDDSAVWQDNQ